MAKRRIDVERLYVLARDRWALAGDLKLDDVWPSTAESSPSATYVIFERNDHLIGIANTQRGTASLSTAPAEAPPQKWTAGGALT